jgi:hypothetical protein
MLAERAESSRVAHPAPPVDAPGDPAFMSVIIPWNLTLRFAVKMVNTLTCSVIPERGRGMHGGGHVGGSHGGGQHHPPNGGSDVPDSPDIPPEKVGGCAKALGLGMMVLVGLIVMILCV